MFIDRDYKPDLLFTDIIAEAAKDCLRVAVWSRKEIENYFLDANLIHSYLGRSGTAVEFELVDTIIKDVVAELEAGLTVLIADGLQTADRKLALPTAMAKAAAIIDERCAAGVPPRDIVGGKKALSMISERCQSAWGLQISSMSLCRYMSLDDVPAELRLAVESLV